jgi:hypothetical protein
LSSRAVVLVVALAVQTLTPAVSQAAATARMSAAFTPDRLGAATTVSFAFRVGTAGRAPPPLSAVSIAYPRNLGLATSGLGLAACSPAQLEAQGPKSCPANSRMGSGTAQVELRFGPALVHETVTLTLLAGPSPDGYLHVLIYASGVFPVEAAVVLAAVLLPGHLRITVPPIPSLPEAPYVSLAELHMVLGGKLTYYETVKGQNVPYHPAGVALPDSCPNGGFPFAASFDFLDGSSSHAHTAVACPRDPPRRARR